MSLLQRSRSFHLKKKHDTEDINKETQLRVKSKKSSREKTEQRTPKLSRKNSVSSGFLHELKNNALYNDQRAKLEDRKSKSAEFLEKSVHFNLPQQKPHKLPKKIKPPERKSISLSDLNRKSYEEMLKTLEISKPDHSFTPYVNNKFPLIEQDEGNVEVRNQNIQSRRVSRTTDFDCIGTRKLHSSAQDFDVKGCAKIQLPNTTSPVKLKKNEIIKYQNENIYQYDESKKWEKKILQHNVVLKSARLLNKRDVELRDTNSRVYILYFESSKDARHFIEHEKISCYVENDNKSTITQRLLRLLGKRSSREVLEKKGIYQNEPIFGNTLKNIFHLEGGVPKFILRTIELIERPENITSLGIYRTSGNLATIQKIRFVVDMGMLDILNDYAKDPDVLTGCLKLFFRELKEPLIPCRTCDSLLIITNGEKQYTKKDREHIKATIKNQLPECNAEILRILIKHLIEVVKYKEQNKMDTYNLAVCWGPTIIFATDTADVLRKDLVTQSTEATRLFDSLLTFYINNPEELDFGIKIKQDSINSTNKSTFQRQDSRDSIQSSDSNQSKNQKKSSSTLSLDVEDYLKKYVELIELNFNASNCGGLYVKQGSLEKTNKIMKKMTRKKISEIDKYKYDVHELTDALKKYLREQEPLLTKEVVEQTNKLCDTSQCLEQNTRQKIIMLIKDLPRRDTLIFLIKHLIRVIAHENCHNVPKSDMICIWSNVFNFQRRVINNDEKFSNFLRILLEVFDESKPDITPPRGMTNGLLNDLKNHQKEKDRISKYDNVPDEPEFYREATILEEKTDFEHTKL